MIKRGLLFRYDPQNADGKQLRAGLLWLTRQIPLRADRFAHIHPRATEICANAAWRIGEGLALTYDEVCVITWCFEQVLKDQGLDQSSAPARRLRPLLNDLAILRTRGETGAPSMPQRACF